MESYLRCDSNLIPSSITSISVEARLPLFEQLWFQRSLSALGILMSLTIGALFVLNLHSNRKLRTSNERLSSANQSMEELTYAVAHDLKSPLRNIAQLSDLLSMNHNDCEERKELAALMRERTTRIQNHITGLLTYARDTSSASPPEPIPLRTFIEELIDTLDVPRNVTCCFVGQDATIVAQRQLLTLAIQNLLTNAVRSAAKRKHGRVTVSIPSLPPQEILVEDNGIGIHPDQRENIFQMFSTLEPAYSDGGSGIGLAVVKRVVENWNGSIQVESEEGKGARFRITLPK